jgi:thiamine biosynthesis lipoprotein
VIQRVRTRAEIQVWGTVVFVDVASEAVSLEQLNAGIEKVRDFVAEVDTVFSTYKSGSVISKLRKGEISIADCQPDVQEVWNACSVAREITGGSFDPWCVNGGFDPSGYVKGWAADKCINILKVYGAENIQINAAGDLSLAGGFNNWQPWSIGIRHPEHADQIVKVFELTDGAIATSGTYEKGAHIKDPHTGLIAIGSRSATVCGPDGGLADALATALIVSGKEGAIWFGKPELAQYSAWVIDRHLDIAWTVDSKSFVL